MKKLSILLIGAALTVGLVGCGKTDNTDTKKAKDDVTIGMSFPSADHGWMGAVIQYAKDEAKAEGVKFQMTTADNVSKQTNDVDDLITKKVDAIVMLPMESDALSPAATKIKDNKIPLVVFDREVSNGDYTALVKGDNEGIGKNAASFIGKKLDGKGNVVIISGPPSSVEEQRTGGFEDVIKDKYPNIKILGKQDGNFTREKGYTVMQNFLTANKHIDAVYTEDDEMALGALKAIEESGRKDIKVVTGAGGAKEFYGKIKDSKNIELATFTYSPLMIKEAVKDAIDLAKGNKLDKKDNTLEAEQVSKDNIDKYYKKDAAY